MTIVLIVLVSFCRCDETLAKNSLGKRGFYLAFPSRSSHVTKGSEGGSQGRNLRDNVLITTQEHLPRYGTLHSGLWPLASFNNQDSPP